MVRSLLVLLCLTPAALHADEPKLRAKAETVAPPDELAADVRERLADRAVVVTDGGGSGVMTVWFRTDVPVRATDEQVKNGLTYREIPVGTLIGAVRLDRAWVNYRKDEIAAGVYTLRFALQPETGDHTGTAPHPDFLLLSPAAKDREPGEVEAKRLVELSAAATGGSHPGVMPLFPHRGKADGPAVEEKGGGVWVVSVRRPVSAGGTSATLGFSLAVAGHAKD